MFILFWYLNLILLLMIVIRMPKKSKVVNSLHLLLSIILHFCVYFLRVTFLANDQALHYKKALSLEISVRHNMHIIRSHLQLLNNCYFCKVWFAFKILQNADFCYLKCIKFLTSRIEIFHWHNTYLLQEQSTLVNKTDCICYFRDLSKGIAFETLTGPEFYK